VIWVAMLLQSGEVKVVIDKVYPLGEAPRAVAYILGNHARGKAVTSV
jgi:NADPH:quinone reductase-like Zn-dependent oxidoreductase